MIIFTVRSILHILPKSKKSNELYIESISVILDCIRKLNNWQGLKEYYGNIKMGNHWTIVVIVLKALYAIAIIITKMIIYVKWIISLVNQEGQWSSQGWIYYVLGGLLLFEFSWYTFISFLDCTYDLCIERNSNNFSLLSVSCCSISIGCLISFFLILPGVTIFWIMSLVNEDTTNFVIWIFIGLRSLTFVIVLVSFFIGILREWGKKGLSLWGSIFAILFLQVLQIVSALLLNIRYDGKLDLDLSFSLTPGTFFYLLFCLSFLDVLIYLQTYFELFKFSKLQGNGDDGQTVNDAEQENDIDAEQGNVIAEQNESNYKSNDGKNNRDGVKQEKENDDENKASSTCVSKIDENSHLLKKKR